MAKTVFSIHMLCLLERLVRTQMGDELKLYVMEASGIDTAKFNADSAKSAAISRAGR